jgi:hypothetical protein
MVSLITKLRQLLQDTFCQVYKAMSYHQFHHHVFRQAPFLEFHNNIQEYLHAQSLLAFPNEKLAFPDEMRQRLVLIMISEAYTEDLPELYITLHINPSADAELDVCGIKICTTSLHHN